MSNGVAWEACDGKYILGSGRHRAEVGCMLDSRAVPRLVVLSLWEDELDLPSRLPLLVDGGLASHMITV